MWAMVCPLLVACKKHTESFQGQRSPNFTLTLPASPKHNDQGLPNIETSIDIHIMRNSQSFQNSTYRYQNLYTLPLEACTFQSLLEACQYHHSDLPHF
jgi:hypothetical protein